MMNSAESMYHDWILAYFTRAFARFMPTKSEVGRPTFTTSLISLEIISSAIVVVLLSVSARVFSTADGSVLISLYTLNGCCHLGSECKALYITGYSDVDSTDSLSPCKSNSFLCF